VKFWTPFGDDYLLAEMRERNDGEPKLLLSPLSSNGIKYGMGINKVLFNSLTSPIIPFGQYYEVGVQKLILVFETFIFSF